MIICIYLCLTNSLDLENSVPTSTLVVPTSTSVVLSMIGASDPPPADDIPASPEPHPNSLGSNRGDQSPGSPRSAQRPSGPRLLVDRLL